MNNRMILRCVECGAGIYTNDKNRTCYKCDSKMKFECMEREWGLK